MPQKSILAWPRLDRQVWILVAGRFLSLIGTGFTMFYAPIFFTKYVGLTAAAVGFGLGSSQLPGILARILGGTLSDAPAWGRRSILLLSAVFCAIGSLTLAFAGGFLVFVLGNLIKGFGVGLFWPASEALVADLTDSRQRVEAYAFTRLADNLGLGIGVVLGGLLIQLSGAYRALFVIDSISYLVFFGILFQGIAEPKRHQYHAPSLLKGWPRALTDYRLLVFLPLNLLFTFYLSQISSTLPLQFSKFADQGSTLPPWLISGIFTWYVFLSAGFQIPVTRYLKRFSHPRALALAGGLWTLGFLAIWAGAAIPEARLALAFLALAIVALATVTFAPAASSLVADLAPPSLRGVYSSVNSLCWAAGYFFGPWLGGRAMDLPPGPRERYWLALALSTLVAFAILAALSRIVPRHPVVADASTPQPETE